MALLITSYLVLTNMSTTKYKVFTAMDGFMYICKMFVIGAMLEFAWVMRINTKEASSVTAVGPPRVVRQQRRDPNSHFEKFKEFLNLNQEAKSVPVEEKCRIIDSRSFLVFNILFILFALIYAIVLSNIDSS